MLRGQSGTGAVDPELQLGQRVVSHPLPRHVMPLNHAPPPAKTQNMPKTQDTENITATTLFDATENSAVHNPRNPLHAMRLRNLLTQNTVQEHRKLDFQYSARHGTTPHADPMAGTQAPMDVPPTAGQQQNRQWSSHDGNSATLKGLSLVQCKTQALAV